MKQHKMPKAHYSIPSELNNELFQTKIRELEQAYEEANNDAERNKTIDEWRHLDCEGWK